MATSVSDSYTIPGALNFKRLKNQGESTTIETKSMPGQRSRLMEQMRKFKCIENFIKHKLYHKYASSQNYYYLRDINSILNEERTLAVIEYKDCLSMQAKEERLKKFYRAKDYKSQISKLTEYYKYHKEIPRIFAKEVYDTFFDHHDQKRKAEFVVITKKLREEAGEDVKGELEQALKKMRDSKYQPLLAELKPFVAVSYKGKISTDNRNPAISQSTSGLSLQQKLNNIFTNQADLSMSQLSMKSVIDEADVLFARHLRSSLAAKDIPAPIIAGASFKKSVAAPNSRNVGRSAVVVDLRAEAEYNPSGVSGSPKKLPAKYPVSSNRGDERGVPPAGSNGNSKVPSREISRQGSLSTALGKNGQTGLISVRQLSVGAALAGPATTNQGMPPAKFVNSVIRASLSPEIVASLKKIQLPSEEAGRQKHKLGSQQLTSGLSSPGISIKPISMMSKPITGFNPGVNEQSVGKPQVVGTHSRTTSQISKPVAEGSQVSGSLTTYGHKPSGSTISHLPVTLGLQSTSRGISIGRSNEEISEPASLVRNNSGGFRREGSEFRITKKSSMEEVRISPQPKAIGSKRNAQQPYLFSERDHVVEDDNMSAPPISSDLMRSSAQNFASKRGPSLSKLNYDNKMGAVPLTTAAKHQKQNSLNAANLHSVRRIAPAVGKITQSNFDIAGSIYSSGSAIQKPGATHATLSSRQPSNSSNLDAVNFKMNVDRLIRASGAIDFKTVTQGVSAGFGSGPISQQPAYQRSQTNAYQNFLQPSKNDSSTGGLKHKHSKSQPLGGSSRENSVAESTSRLGSQVMLVKASPSLNQVANLMSNEFSTNRGSKPIQTIADPKSSNRGLSSAHKGGTSREREYSTAKINISKGSMIWAGAEEADSRKRMPVVNSNPGLGSGLDSKVGGGLTGRTTVAKQPFTKKPSISEYSGQIRQGTSGGGITTRPHGGYLGNLMQEDRPAYAKKEIKLVKKSSHQKTGSTNF